MLIVEIERVLVEFEDRELRGGAIELLSVAIDQENPRALVGGDERPALGDDRDRLLVIAFVLHEEAGQLAIGFAGPNEDRQILRNRRERAFLQNRRYELVSDLELQILEGAVGRWNEIGGQREQHDAAEHTEQHRRFCQAELAK